LWRHGHARDATGQCGEHFGDRRERGCVHTDADRERGEHTRIELVGGVAGDRFWIGSRRWSERAWLNVCCGSFGARERF
jgi:hypothetical protein